MIGRYLIREGFFNRVKNIDRPELEQSVLRVAIGGIVMLYLFWYALQDGAFQAQEYAVLCVSVGFFLFGLALTAFILVVRGVSVLRRYLGMIADNAVTTFSPVVIELAAIANGVAHEYPSTVLAASGR